MIIVWSIIAFLSWGISDFLVFTLARRINLRIGVFGMHAYSSVGLGLYAVFVPSVTPISERNIIALLLGSVFYTLAWISYFRGLREGLLSLLSPLAAGFGFVSALIGISIFGDALSFTQTIAVMFALVGIVLVSVDNIGFHFRERPLAKGVQYALIAMLCWGFMPVFWRPSVIDIGPILTVLGTKILTLIILGVLVRTQISRLSIRSHLLVAGAGLTDAVALVAYNIGIAQNTALVAPIASSYVALTALLGYLLLKERPQKHQLLGIAFVVIAIVGISVTP